MPKTISSFQNKEIRSLVQLQEKSRIRKREGRFVIEGRREIQLARKGGYKISSIFYCPKLITAEEFDIQLEQTGPAAYSIPEELYTRLAYRGSTEGIIAIAETRSLSLSEVRLQQENPLILVAEAPEKPGNIGALLRTADAAGVDAVLIANLGTDLYNPNIIRSSVGCVFTTQIGLGSTVEILNFLNQRDIPIYGAALQASVPYYTADLTGAAAIVVGTEATGLSDLWLKNSRGNLVIPMQGEIDSMNVSVAAGILIFEAVRQRRSAAKG